MRRRLTALTILTAAGLAGRAWAAKRRGPVNAVASVPGWRDRISAHESFGHDSLDSLGYDWSRIAAPDSAPRLPFRLYLPRTTEDVVRIVKEARTLDEPIVVRGSGHSSNDLVVTDGGTMLLTRQMNAVVALDEAARTVTVQAGAITAELDAYLGQRGFGLPVIGDHSDITAGGFASAGGISTTSHRFGLFIDNVERLEYVSWEGEVVACSRSERSADFYRLLAGTGQHGVITTLTLRIIPIDKRGTILEKRQRIFTNLEDFIAASAEHLLDQGDALMRRSVWLDMPALGRSRRFGHITAYHDTKQTAIKRAWNAVAYSYLHRLGYLAGRMPATLDRFLKILGTASVLISPRYASIKNNEVFIDRILDYTVGDPTRWLVVFAPVGQYEALFRVLLPLFLEFRARHQCFTFISLDVGPVRSAYLAHGSADDRFCWLMFYAGIDPRRLTPALLDELVARVDDICIGHGAYRYMHTRTTKDPDRRRRIDPNDFYARGSAI